MSLDVWLRKGRKVVIGGKEMHMMPLPLVRLYDVGKWLEDNAGTVIREAIQNSGDQVPNPISLIATVLLRVDVSSVALTVFSEPENPDTGEKVNKNLTKEFFDKYLDIPTAQEMFQTFIELNDLEKLIKNLQSLPAIKKLMEASSLAFGIPFLNSLRQSTDLSQSGSEGSRFPKSIVTTRPATKESSENGATKPTIQ